MVSAHLTILAAQQHRARLEAEEEEMTSYSSEDLDGEWEFKIVRSVGREFHKPEVLQALIEEEARAGWELLEKFDDRRIRFKRSSSRRRSDGDLPANVDPYRTQYGISEERLAFNIIAGLVAVVLGILAVAAVIGSF